MQSRTFLPGHSLESFVECFWYLEDWDPVDPRERILPTGNLELLIDVSGGKIASQTGVVVSERNQSNPALIKGIHSRFLDIDTRAHVSLIGIEFKPGGSYPFFAVPAGEFHNLQIPLIDLWKADLSHLEDRLLDAVAVEDCFRILEEFLLAKILRHRQLNPAVVFALDKFQRQYNPDKISQVVRQTGYSAKHFIKLFREQVGLSPKLFSRLQRFHRSIAALATTSEPHWAELAADCGFFDQSHFINEFRYFSGLTPAMYLKKFETNLNQRPRAVER